MYQIDNEQYKKTSEREFCLGCGAYRIGQMCAMQDKCNRVYIVGYKNGVEDCTKKLDEAEDRERDKI